MFIIQFWLHYEHLFYLIVMCFTHKTNLPQYRSMRKTPAAILFHIYDVVSSDYNKEGRRGNK